MSLPAAISLPLLLCSPSIFTRISVASPNYIAISGIMLRRKPTAIQLTSEDLAIYEDRKDNPARQENIAQQNAHGDGKGVVDPNDELKPLPGDKTRTPRVAQTRDERMGIGR